jgi:hypothetical protein
MVGARLALVRAPMTDHRTARLNRVSWPARVRILPHPSESGAARGAAISRIRQRVQRQAAWIGLLVVLAWCGLARAGSVQIITSGDHANATLDRATVRAIFAVRLREWPDGVPIRVFVLPDGDPLHVEFCREQLGTFPYVLRASWDRLVYTGTGIAPEVVANEKEMRRRVAMTRGAIGYVSTQEPAPGAVDTQTRPGTAVGNSR